MINNEQWAPAKAGASVFERYGPGRFAIFGFVKKPHRTYRYLVQEPMETVKEKMGAQICEPSHFWDDRDLRGDLFSDGKFTLKLINVGFYKGPPMVDAIQGRIIGDEQHTRIEVVFTPSLGLPIFCGFIFFCGLIGSVVKGSKNAPFLTMGSLTFLFQSALALFLYYWLSNVFLQTSQSRFERLLFTVLRLKPVDG